jgi:hypothetical protein
LAAQQQAANSAQTQSVQNGDSRTNSSSRLSVQYHPSFTDQGVVEVDRNKTLDGIPGSVSDYIVRVTNTGDVRLFCDASASALTASGSGASCTGKRIEDCTNGQQFNTSDTAYVSPGNTADVVTIRYYLRNGTYQLGCHAEP